MIERTFDYRRIKKMLPCPPIISDNIIYLIDGNHGIWIFHEYLNGLKIHVEMNINCRGKEAIKKGRESLEWVFNNIAIKCIYAGIYKLNKPSCYYARRIGMEFTYEENNMRHYKINRIIT